MDENESRGVSSAIVGWVAMVLLLGALAQCDARAQTDPAGVVPSRTDDSGAVGPRLGGRDGALRAALEEVEEYAGVPARLRGMTLAAAMQESKLAPWVIAGIKRGDGGRAVGIIQAHWWLRDWCEIDDEPLRPIDRCLPPEVGHCGVGVADPVLLTRCWLEKIVAILPKARRRCPGWDPWIPAWAWVAQGPKDPDTGEWYRCRAPRHLDVLRRMRR
jgi:hypothetical protein